MREVGGDAIAHFEVGLVRDPAEPAAREVHRRHDDQHAERELPRHQHDDDDRADEQEDVLDEQHEALRDELLHRVDVGGHARHDPAGLLGLEVVERQRHQVIEQAVAQLAQERLADARDEQDRQAAEEEAANAMNEVEHDREVQRARRRGRESPWSMPYRTSAGPASSVPDLRDQHDHDEGDLPPVRPQHPQQPAQHPLAPRRATASRRGRRRPSARRLSRPPPPPPLTPATRLRPRSRRPARPRRARAPRGTRALVASSPSCVPSATTRPSSSSTTRSASAIVAGRWAMMIVVRPVHHLRNALRISCSFVGSTDDVASSRIRTRGSASTARAIAMR